MAILRVKPRKDVRHRTKVLKNVLLVFVLALLASASVSQDDIIDSIISLAIQKPIVAIIILLAIGIYLAYSTLSFELDLKIRKEDESDNDKS